MIVVDASVAIAMLNRNEAHHARATAIVLDHDDLILHPITAAQIYAGPARTGRGTEVARALESLHFRIDIPDAGQPARLADLRARTTLKLPDCCVLDAALMLRVPLATFDNELAAQARSNGVDVITADGETSSTGF